MASCGAKADDEKVEPKKVENYNDGLSPADRMSAIKELFEMADESGDKLIDLEEWLAAAKKKDGDKFDKKESTKLFKVIDQSNSGTISLAEFDLHIVNLQMEGVRVRFKAADTSKDRKLDKKEFGKFFSAEGMKKKAIAKLWKKCDKNKDGKVSYTEFSDWMEREMADGVLAETFGFDADAVAERKKKAKEAQQAKIDAKKKA